MRLVRWQVGPSGYRIDRAALLRKCLVDILELDAGVRETVCQGSA